jgi:hypothetical protein
MYIDCCRYSSSSSSRRWGLQTATDTAAAAGVYKLLQIQQEQQQNDSYNRGGNHSFRRCSPLAGAIRHKDNSISQDIGATAATGVTY